MHQRRSKQTAAAQTYNQTFASTARTVSLTRTEAIGIFSEHVPVLPDINNNI